ncbi:biotin--[acetyl-CoA-carboxylase] ligase [Halorubellus salinus]|uniref:biotin--[acetyl-CoA-carboxylase] ligase n=1 Tax=Halorubellus salinus TaxID=755309 RepID=UPI001D07D4BC|nr:biotin--[acetyl-CoA-carboxylase] ligase [Halorubellus salinus]
MNDTRLRVLDALADGPVTGPALADALDVSRAAVWKHVETLRDAGFEVSSTDDGYRLDATPEYGGLAVAHELAAPYAVDYHDSVGSTNDRARELAADGERDVAVVAAEQTGSRGRLDREWTAPRGGVWTSILVRPDVPPAQVPVFTLAAAVATANAAREAGVDAGIKWPNDVLVPDGDGGTRKLSGILTEMEGEADRVSWLVVGIGANVDIPERELPAGATSVAMEGGVADRRAFVQRVLEGFHDLVSGDLDAVLPAWRERSLTLGQRVRVETPGGVVEGVARDVEFPGALLVETDDGVERVTAGDCEHLRAAD